MDEFDIFNQLTEQIQESLQPMNEQNQKLKQKLHYQYDDLEQFINQNSDQQQDKIELTKKLNDTDKSYIDCQKKEFLIKIMNLIIKILKQKILLYDLNKYLTYLKHMIDQYFNDQQSLQKIKNGIEIYYFNTSFLCQGDNKLDFFSTQNNGYYFLNDFLQLKKIQKNHQIHKLPKHYFNLPMIENTSCSGSTYSSQNYSMLDSVIIM